MHPLLYPVIIVDAMATAVCFTGGKDSMLALHLVSNHQHPSTPWQNSQVPAVVLLVTFAPPNSDFKAHPLPIIKHLAAAVRIKHMLCEVSGSFLDSYKQHMQHLHQHHGITHLVTGDILDVGAGFMEAATAGSGVQLVRPLWQCPRRQVLQALQDLNIRSIISCVDLSKYKPSTGGAANDCLSQQEKQQGPQHDAEHTQQHQELPCPGSQQSQQEATKQLQLHRPQHSGSTNGTSESQCETLQEGFNAVGTLLGQELTRGLVDGPLALAEVLCGADLCGEQGEYHTVVFDAPLMLEPAKLTVTGHRVVQSGAHQHAYIVWSGSA